MKTVLVDMDGVLAQWENGFVKILKRLHPHIRPVAYEDRRGFYVHKNYPVEHHDALLDVMNDPSLYADLEPIEGGVQAVNEMLDEGLDVALCSSPYLSNPTGASAKYDWAIKHLGERWGDRTVLTRDKTRVRGDILIDDKSHVHGQMTPTWKHVIFDASYNREVIDRPRLECWSQWREVVLPLLEG